MLKFIHDSAMQWLSLGLSSGLELMTSQLLPGPQPSSPVGISVLQELELEPHLLDAAQTARERSLVPSTDSKTRETPEGDSSLSGEKCSCSKEKAGVYKLPKCLPPALNGAASGLL